MQHILEGRNNRFLILADVLPAAKPIPKVLAKENVPDECDTLVLIDIQNSRGRLLATMTCEKQRLKDVVALLK